MMQPWQAMLVKTIPANQLSAKPDSEGAAAEWLEKVALTLPTLLIPPIAHHSAQLTLHVL